MSHFLETLDELSLSLPLNLEAKVGEYGNYYISIYVSIYQSN
jgi:hypothetical protein